VGPFRQGKPLVLPTPELDAYERELRTRAHRKVIYTVIGCVVLVAPLVVLFLMATVPEALYRLKHPLRGVSPAAAALAQASITRAREVARREEQAARTGIERAVAEGLDPHPELGRCPSPGVLQGAYSPGFRRLAEAHVCLACDALASQASLLEGSLRERSREADLDEGVARGASALDRSAARLGAVVVIQITAEAAPRGVPHAGFTAGHVRGRSYLWDTQGHQVLCVGDFAAESSVAVDYKYMTRGPLDPGGPMELHYALERDLADRTREAVHASLRYRAGPHIVD
jgi:hypothetical protein